MKTIFTVLEIAGIGVLTGMAIKADAAKRKTERQLLMRELSLVLADATIELQKNEIKKLKKEIEKLKREA